MLIREARQRPSCGVCGAPCVGEIWGVQLCEACIGAWRIEPRFDAGEVERAAGSQLDAVVAEYRKRMAAWVGEHRKPQVSR